MPQTSFKRAEYKTQRDTAPYTVKRSEWYRCSEGLTIGNRITAEGEILHISDLDTDVLDPNTGSLYKAETFVPLSLPEQERRFGRIMYMPYNPSDEELVQLGWERVVAADDVASDEQLMELHGDDFEREVDSMGEEQLRHEAQFRFGHTFPAGMPARRMRSILLKMYKDEDGEFGKNRVTEQMAANIAQRVPSQEAVAAADDVDSNKDDEVDPDVDDHPTPKRSKKHKADDSTTGDNT